MIESVGLIGFAYLLGSVPFGLLLGKARGMDVRCHGSGNIGATNVARLLGKGWGVATLVLDMVKAVVPMVVAGWLLTGSPARETVVALSGAAAFLGHCFPLYLRFRGGKGVACALGMFLYLAPWAALIAAVVFVLVVGNWGYVSLGSLSASLLMPGLVWLLYRSWEYALLALFVAAVIWFQHRENIARLRRGEEKSWKRRRGQ